MATLPKYSSSEAPSVVSEVPEIQLKSFTKDEICQKCGTWKTEHDWDACQTPLFLADTSD